jgi:hemoglobin-like flavoprotein
MNHAAPRQAGDTAQLVIASLARAGERCADLTPLVYARLFEVHPETRSMFRAEARDLVKGSMLQMALEAILDFVGERNAHFRMIACEAQNHDGQGTPPELFKSFFTVIVDALRDLLGEDWSPAVDAAWRATLVELERHIDQALGLSLAAPASRLPTGAGG